MAFTKSSLPCFGQERSKFLCHLSIQVKQSKSSYVYGRKGRTESISKAHSSLGGIQKLQSATFACLKISQSVTTQISTQVSHGSVTSLENCPVPAESTMPKVDMWKAFWHERKASFSKGLYVVEFLCIQSSFFVWVFFIQTLAYCLNMTHCLRGGVYLQDQVFGVNCWIVCSSPFSCARILDSNLKETWPVVPFLCFEFNPTEFHRSMLSKSGGGLGDCFLISVSIPILAIPITLWEVFWPNLNYLKMVWILGLFL